MTDVNSPPLSPYTLATDPTEIAPGASALVSFGSADRLAQFHWLSFAEAADLVVDSLWIGNVDQIVNVKSPSLADVPAGLFNLMVANGLRLRVDACHAGMEVKLLVRNTGKIARTVRAQLEGRGWDSDLLRRPPEPMIGGMTGEG